MNKLKEMSSKERRATFDLIRRENAKYGETLVKVNESRFRRLPGHFTPPIAAYRNKRFIVQIFQEKSDILRMSVNRTAIDEKGNWLDGIVWDELQSLKNQLFPDREAVEFYPSQEDMVNIANIRHLWVLPKKLDFGWKDKPVQKAEIPKEKVSLAESLEFAERHTE